MISKIHRFEIVIENPIHTDFTKVTAKKVVAFFS